MRGLGIEPSSPRWQRDILPINYPRIFWSRFYDLKIARLEKMVLRGIEPRFARLLSEEKKSLRDCKRAVLAVGQQDLKFKHVLNF